MGAEKTRILHFACTAHKTVECAPTPRTVAIVALMRVSQLIQQQVYNNSAYFGMMRGPFERSTKIYVFFFFNYAERCLTHEYITIDLSNRCPIAFVTYVYN